LLPLHFAPPLVELTSNSNLLLQQQTTPKKNQAMVYRIHGHLQQLNVK